MQDSKTTPNPGTKSFFILLCIMLPCLAIGGVAGYSIHSDDWNKQHFDKLMLHQVMCLDGFKHEITSVDNYTASIKPIYNNDGKLRRCEDE